MAEEENKPKVEPEKEKTPTKVEEKKAPAKAPEKKEEKKEAKPEEKKEEKKTDDKKPEDKAKQAPKEPTKEQPKVSKKDEAAANGINLRASKKHCMYICDHIKNKKIDDAIKELGEVTIMKRVIPFKGEIPHRKGKGMMSGRYPVKAAGMFIPLLKGLRGNVIVNGMELENTRIVVASPSWASRPMRSGNRQGKRTNVILIAREIKKAKKKEAKK